MIQEDKSATLATNNDQYLSQPMHTHIIDNIGGQAEYAKASEVNGTLRAGVQGAIAYSVENHPADSRVNIDESGKVQTLTSRMGTGGGNVPMVMMATQQGGAEIRTDGKAPTLTAAAGMSGNNQPVICLQGNGIDRADTAGCNGKGWREDAAYTLNTIDRPAVVYAVDQGGGKSGANVHEDKAPTLCTTHGGEPAVVYRQGGFADYVEGEVGTLKAAGGDLGGGSENLAVSYCIGNGQVNDAAQTEREVCKTLNCMADPMKIMIDRPTPPHYIVRRLTPTECARLQGFADKWGHVEQKDALSDEEYAFWCEVRNTHAAINGKKVQDYTPKQMLTWYNKLWTDSAEYKMWGNGIALPPALYCMQGMVDVMDTTLEWYESHEEKLRYEAHKGEVSPVLKFINEMFEEAEKKTEEEKQQEAEPTDLSDAPEEIKEEIMSNAEQLERREGTTVPNPQPTTATVHDFNAAAQLKRLADERKALANINPDSNRFADDIRALEYAINILEVVGL